METILNKLILFSFLNTHNLEASVACVGKAYHKLSDELPSPLDKNCAKKLCAQIIPNHKPIDNLTLTNFKECINEIIEDENFSVNFVSWYQFYKESQSSERLAFLLSQYLRMSDSDVADLLNISIGSVRYRVSESYQKFAKVIKYA